MVKIAFVLISGDILKMRSSKKAEALIQEKCVYFLSSFEIVLFPGMGQSLCRTPKWMALSNPSSGKLLKKWPDSEHLCQFNCALG